ncbi:MAG: hypothetical protein Q9195_003180 [Heterodermia aff. obscurata]
MDFATRPSSFLPSIKCSNCNAEIEIAMMGDHVCEQNRPYQPNAFAPSRPSKLSRSGLPNATTKDARSPFSPLSRSATLPLTPPSPEARSQDGAFPIFPRPTSKSRSNTPTTPSEPDFSSASNSATAQSQSDSFGVFAPFSPKRRGGDDVMKKLNAIAPGPFDTNNNGDPRNLGHKRTATSSSTEDFIRSPNSGNFSRHSPQSSDASSHHSRNTSMASQAAHFRRNRSAESSHSSTLTSAVSKPSTSIDSYDRTPFRDDAQSVQSRPVIGQLGRSQTSPAESTSLGGRQESSSIASRIERDPPSSRPSSHRPRPSVAAAIRPLDEIGSMSSFKPSRSLRMRKESTATAADRSESLAATTEARSDKRFQDVPPVPMPTQALDFGIGNPYHLSTESASSNDSSGSDVKTSSSRSTPPLSDSPQRPKRKADTSRLDKLLSGFQLDLDNAPVTEQPAPPRWVSPPSFSRPLYAKPVETALQRGSAAISPTSKLQPSHQDDLSPGGTPAASPDDYPAPAYPPISRDDPPPSSAPTVLSEEYAQQDSLHQFPTQSPLPPPPQAPLPRPRRTAAKKGNCKGCGELIMGKSVSSADGRLTGRYHKPCFVCKTCKEPFQTTDFYVMNNHPYCGRHYHQLNDSLCKSCDQGIEGQYLETELKQKFHPHCFTCHDCQQMLRDDYFEMNGHTYCEQHALRAAQQTRFLGPGRRHPERRTTRLMMM